MVTARLQRMRSYDADDTTIMRSTRAGLTFLGRRMHYACTARWGHHYVIAEKEAKNFLSQLTE